jgi:hypothetical protein
MTKQTMRSQLMARYGQRLDDAVRGHAQDETTLGGFTRLPGGITNGVAQLQGVKFDTYKTGKTKGEWYCQFEGVVVSPEEVMTPNGPVWVAGMQFRKNMPVCDTTKQDGTQVTLDENVANILNQMRLLADPPGTPMEQSFTSGAAGEDLERLGEILSETAPCFNFSTRESPARDGFPARVWEDWGAMVQHTQEPQQGVSVEGQPAPSGVAVPRQGQPAAPAGNGQGAPARPAPAQRATQPPARPASQPQPAAPAPGPSRTQAAPARAPAAPPRPAAAPQARPAAPPPRAAQVVPAAPAASATSKAPAAPTARRGRQPAPPPAPAPAPAPAAEEQPFDEFGDLDALAERADAGVAADTPDDDAEQALTDAATRAGLDESVVTNAPSWADLVEMIRGGVPAATEGRPADEPQGEGEWQPVVGEVHLYAPVNPRTKQPGKAVECEVSAVDEASQTCQLLNLADGKTVYRKVPWAALTAEQGQ